jgi:hypothetical protein
MSESGGAVKRCVVAPPGWELWFFDFCLARGTRVKTLLGDVPIETLKVGDKVYGYDFASEKITWETVTSAESTGEKPAWKLVLDNGEVVVGTHDHRMIMFDGSERELQNVVAGDSLMPIRQTVHPSGRVYVYAKSAFYYRTRADIVAEAWLGVKPRGADTHHKDTDCNNDSPNNLIYLSETEHRRLHGRSPEAKKWLDLARQSPAYYAGIHKRNQSGHRNPNYGNLYGQFVVECVQCGLSTVVYRSEVNRRGYLRRGFCSKNCERAAKTEKNHKVVASYSLKNPQEMFRVGVTGNHNYALSCGVISKNCAMEFAVFGLLAGVREILDAYAAGEDLHGTMARRVIGPNFTPEDRTRIKTLDFMCLASGTPVLTDSGWIPIEQVTTTHRVWDGNTWVQHNGVVSRGRQPCIAVNSVWMTKEHEVWTPIGWQQSQDIRHQVLAPDMANWSWLPLLADQQVGLSPSNAVALAVEQVIRFGIISLSDEQLAALLVGVKRRLRGVSKTTPSMISFLPATANECEEGCGTPLLDVTRGQTRIMVEGGSRYGQPGEKTSVNSCGISLRWTDGTILCSTLTELITTGGTYPETCDSLPGQKMCETHDIVNAGPNRRFQAGPLLVSNCIYGGGIRKLATSMKVSLAEAKDIKAIYDEKFPSIRAFMKQCKRDLQRLGYVEDYFGKRYHVEYGAEYKAVNALIQGGCASGFKIALLNIAAAGIISPECQIMLPVHDENIFLRKQTSPVKDRIFVNRVVGCMQNIPQFVSRGLTLRVDVKRSRTSWAAKTSWPPEEGAA